MPRRKGVDKLKERAYQLFTTTELTQYEIADLVGIASRTLSSWINADNERWRLDKAARGITKEKVIAGYYWQLARIQEAIEKRDEGNRIPTGGEVDQQVKLASAIEKMYKRYDFGIYHTVMDEFTDWLVGRDAEAAGKMSRLSLEFLKNKMKVLNGA